jgi:signal transduction histidine kinase
MLWAVNPHNDSLEKLSAYLNRYAAEYFQNTPVRCRLAFPQILPAIQLSAEMRHNVFLAFEEALANTLKHSAATEVSAELTCHNGTIEISIEDNGCGFDLKQETEAAVKNKTGEHLGLAGMYERLRNVGGECRIQSLTGNGTIIKFVLPISKMHAF